MVDPMADDVAGEVHLDAVIAFEDAWKAYRGLPRDERTGLAIGEVVSTLANDPQFILTAAEKLLREAGATDVTLGNDEDGLYAGINLTRKRHAIADALPEAYAKLKEARNG